MKTTREENLRKRQLVLVGNIVTNKRRTHVVVISYTQVSRIQTGVGLTEQTHKRKKWRKIIQQGENVFSSVRISHESSCDLNRRELLLLLKRLSSFNTYMMD